MQSLHVSTVVRAIAAACALLMSSCQLISGLSELTPDGPGSETEVTRQSDQPEGYMETRTPTGLLARDFGLDPADIAQDIDAGEDISPCAPAVDSEGCTADPGCNCANASD